MLFGDFQLILYCSWRSFFSSIRWIFFDQAHSAIPEYSYLDFTRLKHAHSWIFRVQFFESDVLNLALYRDVKQHSEKTK